MSLVDLLAVRAIGLYWAQRGLHAATDALACVPHESHDAAVERYRQARAHADECQARFIEASVAATDPEFEEAMTQLGELIAHDMRADAIAKSDGNRLTPGGVGHDLS